MTSRSRFQITAATVEDERQLDGSRHLQLIGEDEHCQLTLRLVLDRDGGIQEAELSVEAEEVDAVIGFNLPAPIAAADPLALSLHGEEGTVAVEQLDDGEFTLQATLTEVEE